MATGCQGPFCHGTGGWCGCNCKCCPPPCCPVVSVRFQCVLNPPCTVSVCCCPDPVPDTLHMKISLGTPAGCPPLNNLTWQIVYDSVNEWWYGETTVMSDPGCGPQVLVKLTMTLKCNISCIWEATLTIDNPVTSITFFPTVVSCNPLHLQVASWTLPGCPLCSGASTTSFDITANAPSPFMMGQDNLPGPPQPMPKFDKKPIFSKKKNFLFGGPFPTSTSLPIQPVCVPISTAGAQPGVCCFEIIDGGIVAVGNGYVNAPTSIVSDNGCDSYNVKINGQTPPVWVNDCQAVVVTLEPVNSCCVCEFLDLSCGPCEASATMLYLPQSRLWKKLVNRSNNKIRINPETGLPYVYIDKAELIRRVIERRQKLRRKK